jgi:hypothetical protein
MKGLSFTIIIGKYGGFYTLFTRQAWRICLGWVAFTLYFCDLEAFIQYIRIKK